MITIIPTTIRPYYELIVCSDRIDYTHNNQPDKKSDSSIITYFFYIRVCFLVQRVLCRY